MRRNSVLSNKFPGHGGQNHVLKSSRGYRIKHKRTRGVTQCVAVTLTCCVIALLPSLANAALQQSHFDAVALKWNTGETVVDTPIGIRASPAPVFDGAVNLMLLDSNMALYITEGPTSGGIVKFGLVDASIWTPADGDGIDISSDFASIGDRLFVTVDDTGFVELISAPPLSAGTVLATTTVTLDPNKAFALVAGDEIVRVFYDDEPIAEELLTTGTELADPANLGDDLVISVLSGPTETGAATISHLARNAKLRMSWFPKVLRRFDYQDTVFIHSTYSDGFDILNTSGTADLAFYLTNIGTTTARDVDVELSVPIGVGMSIVSSATENYGDVASGVSTVRAYRIETSATPVGVYPLTLKIRGGTSQTLETSVPVWDLRPEVLDQPLGLARIQYSTPFTDEFSTLTAPEVILSPDEPYFFDIRQSSDHIIHKEPFYGAHWGDALTTDPVFVSPTPAKFSNHTVDLTITIKTRSGKKIPFGIVSLKGPTRAESRIDSDGKAEFTAANFFELPPGKYEITHFPSWRHKKLYGTKKKTAKFEPGKYTLCFVYPDVPVTASAAPNSTPPNGQGVGGKKAGSDASAPQGLPGGSKPATPKGAPPKKRGGKKTGRSVKAGVGAALVTGALDGVGLLGGSFSGPGALLLAAGLSGFATGLAGGITAGKNDPVDQDLLFVAQNNTVPLDPTELTLEEKVEMISLVNPPFTTRAPSTIFTTFTYTRITDQQTYTYSGSETLPHDYYLPLVLETDKDTYVRGEDIIVRVSPQTATSETLWGPDVIVRVYAIQKDPNGKFGGDALLQDDGQGVDVEANDGVYSGVISTFAVIGDVRLMAWVARGGFFQDEVPASFGYEYKDLHVSSVTGVRKWNAYR